MVLEFDESKIRTWKVGEETFVSDEEGNEYLVKGYGSGKGVLMDIDPRIDLTQPIYGQAQKLWESDKPDAITKHAPTA